MIEFILDPQWMVWWENSIQEDSVQEDALQKDAVHKDFVQKEAVQRDSTIYGDKHWTMIIK